MWDGKLTDGAAFLLQAGKSDVGRGCCLQVVTTKNIQQPSGVRLRVVLSDGKHKISAVLASQVCAKVSHVNLEGAIVRINEFQLNGLAQPGGYGLLSRFVTSRSQTVPLAPKRFSSSLAWTFSPTGAQSSVTPLR